MAKATLFFNPIHQFFDDSGSVLNGGTLTFYEPGTTTPKDTYTDSGKGTANPNPMTLDSAGRPDNSGSPIQIWLDGAYKVVLKNSSGTTIRTEDNVTTLGTLFSTLAKTGDYTITESDRDKVVLVDATTGNVTITLPAVATAGDGFVLTVKKVDSSANTVILDADGAELIDLATTLTLSKISDTVSIIGNGTKWNVFSRFKEVANGVFDANGNELLEFETTASAVNHIGITNSATGDNPKIGAFGEADTGITFENDQDEEILVLDSVANAVNELKISNAVTGSNPSISSQGDDTNIGLLVETKGTGSIIFSKDSTRTNSVDDALIVKSTTTGTPAAGLGTGIKFQGESADETESDIGSVSAAFTDVSAGSEDSDIVLAARVAGASLAELYRFRATSSSTTIITHSNSATRTITLPDANITLNAGQAATQADMESASSSVVCATPANAQYHPSASKAWCNFTGTGTAAIQGSYNIASLTDNGTGDYSLEIGIDFSGTGISSVAGAGQEDNSTVIVMSHGIAASAGSVRIRTKNSSFAPLDAARVSLSCFGDQ